MKNRQKKDYKSLKRGVKIKYGETVLCDREHE
jgi:hypothetical protein